MWVRGITINIQPTSDYLNIMALQGISNHLLPHPLYTMSHFLLKGGLFTKVVPEGYQDFFDVFSQEEAKNMPPIATSPALWQRAQSPL